MRLGLGSEGFTVYNTKGVGYRVLDQMYHEGDEDYYSRLTHNSNPSESVDSLSPGCGLVSGGHGIYDSEK